MAILRRAPGCRCSSESSSIQRAKSFRMSISLATTTPRKKDGTAVSMPAPRHPGFRSGNRVGNSAAMKIPDKRRRATIRPMFKAIPAQERAEITFIFVTPRKWNAKDKWAKEKEALGEWESVRAYDASDLEQWLE